MANSRRTPSGNLPRRVGGVRVNPGAYRLYLDGDAKTAMRPDNSLIVRNSVAQELIRKDRHSDITFTPMWMHHPTIADNTIGATLAGQDTGGLRQRNRQQLAWSRGAGLDLSQS